MIKRTHCLTAKLQKSIPKMRVNKRGRGYLFFVCACIRQ
jgi:hypothetical protein